jgi:branched-chain amino acid transport system permease protein
MKPPVARKNRRILLAVVASSAFVILLTAPLFVSMFMVRVLQMFFLSMGLALAWNILGGFAGYWSFGHTLYIGIGAFTAGKLVPFFGPDLHAAWIILACLAAGGLISTLLALILAYPLLRLRGIYFAIAMLGVAELTAEISSNVDAIGGAMGLMVPVIAPDSVEPAIFFYYLFLGMALVVLLIAAWIKNSRFGYGLASIREDEDTAKMLGVPTERYKITASVISSGLVGILGVMYAFYLGYFTTPSVFRIDFSLNMILHNLIGGIGTLAGPILGAGIMVFLINVVLGKLLNIHILITGLLVIAIVLLAPSGIIGTVKAWIEKRRSVGEHHPMENGQDAVGSQQGG